MEMNIWATLQDALTQFYNLLWPMAAALAGVGVATMAILQMIKDISHLRRRFNRWQIKRWLDKRIDLAKPIAPETEIDVEEVHKRLITLATAGDEDAFYSLNIQQLTGQLAAASQIVLDYSWEEEYKALYLCFAAQALQEDVSKLLVGPPEDDEAVKAWARERVDPRNRVNHQIQRTLDGLQIALSYRWKYFNQLAAFILNFIFVLWALLLVGPRKETLLIYVVVAVFGGFVAPVAKDLVRGLQQLRARPR